MTLYKKKSRGIADYPLKRSFVPETRVTRTLTMKFCISNNSRRCFNYVKPKN